MSLENMSTKLEIERLAIFNSPPTSTKYTLQFLGSSGVFDSATSTEELQTPADFVAVLALAQRLEVPFLHIIWHPGLDALGEGATSEVHQSLVTISINFAFKRSLHGTRHAFQALMCELIVLCNPLIRQHSNILHLQGICWNDVLKGDGQVMPVLVFEKAQHGSLDQFITSRFGQDLSFDTRLKLCRDIARAVAAMHTSDVVHGDLKPQNVLVFKDNTGGFEARVSDFGYSTIVAGPDQPIYMPKTIPWNAPEHHHRGFLLPSAKKMDIYSLGLLCLWLLYEPTIRAEFKADNNGCESHEIISANARMRDWIRDKTRGRDLVTCSTFMIQETSVFSDEQKIDLVKFINTTLSSDPSDRTQNIEYLLPLLGDLESQKPIVLQPLPEVGEVPNNIALLVDSPFEIARSFDDLLKADIRIRQHVANSLILHFSRYPNSKFLKEVAFEVAFCYKLGFGVPADEVEAALWLEKSGKQQDDLQIRLEMIQRKPPRRPVSPLVEFLFTSGYFSDIGSIHYHSLDPKHAMLELIEQECQREIVDMLRLFHSPTSYVILHLRFALVPLVRARHEFDRAASLASSIIHDLSNDPEYGPEDLHTLHMKENLAAILSDTGMYKQAIDIERAVVAQKKKILGDSHLATQISSHNLAITLRKEGCYEEAEAIDTTLLKIREQHLGPHHPETLITVNSLGRMASERGLYGQAEVLYRRAFEGLEIVYGPKNVMSLVCANNLATSLYKQGKNGAALEMWQMVLNHRAKHFELTHPASLDIMGNLALVQKEMGQYEAAESLNREVFLRRSEMLGPSHPDTITSVNNLATSLMVQRKYGQAEILLQQALSLHEEVTKSENLELLILLCNLGTTFLQQGKYESALKPNSRALEISRKLLDEDHPTTLSCLGNLAATWNANGESSKAEEAYERAVNGKRKTLGRSNPSTLVSLSNLAAVLEAQGKFQAAEGILREVIEHRSTMIGKRNPKTLKIFHDLARVLWMESKYDEARECATEAAVGREAVFGKDNPVTLESRALLSFIPVDEADEGGDDEGEDDEGEDDEGEDDEEETDEDEADKNKT